MPTQEHRGRGFAFDPLAGEEASTLGRLTILQALTVSRPFPPPSSGKIAIKVINHYGDEVLKVLGV